MFQLIRAAVGEIVSRVSDGEPLKNESIDIREEEVLFCKNNVCVHLARSKHGDDLRPAQDVHIPGYFSLKRTSVSGIIPELILSWVPNSLLTVNNIDDCVQNGLEITTCSEVDSSCVSANELSYLENDEKELNSCEKGNHGKLNTSSIEDVNKSEIKMTLHTECASQPSSTSTSPRDESSGTFSTPYGGIFSINLSDMKALKLFLSNKDGTSGQLVVSNLENQYKVFHFHHSGIDKISDVFNNWEGCQEERDEDFGETLQKVYFVSKNFKTGMKTETGADMHPEDGNYLPLNLISWRGFINAMGQIEDVNNFRKHVFFAGLNQEVRQDAWKFLLYCYPVQSTSFERDRLRKEKEDEYRAIHKKRLALAGEDYENFWKDVQFTVDKDVVRTDRSHPFFAGQENPNIEKMRNILLNYAVYNPDMGYTQGMSDLLSPLLSTIQDEVDTFWCFVGLMEFSLFATTPTDTSMDRSLGYLRELLRVMYPEFYIHCLMQDEELDLLFCHRWLVLCFKREFIEPEVLCIWEACWSRYQTDYFHIFVCVAIIRLYGNRCIQSKMRIDEMMQYFMDMSMQFDGSAVLREARSLLYRFRKFHVIPCTLRGFLSGPGVWDGGIEPEIECMSRHRKCCFLTSNLQDKTSVGLRVNAEEIGKDSPIEIGSEKDVSREGSDTTAEKVDAAEERSNANQENIDVSEETLSESEGKGNEGKGDETGGKLDASEEKIDCSEGMSDTSRETLKTCEGKSDPTVEKTDALAEDLDDGVEKNRIDSGKLLHASGEQMEETADKSDVVEGNSNRFENDVTEEDYKG